jgi:hypothetical protein
MRHQLLILARLAAEPSLTASELASSLASMLERASSGRARAAALRPHIDAAVAAGWVSRPSRGRLAITAAGTAHVTKELGPAVRQGWKTYRARQLAAHALGVKLTDKTSVAEAVVAHLLAGLTGASTRGGDPAEIIKRAVAAAVDETNAEGSKLAGQVVRCWLAGTPPLFGAPAGESVTPPTPPAVPVTLVAPPKPWDDAELISAVQRATAAVPATGRFGDDRVFVSAIWRQLDEGAAFPGLTLDGLKRRLIAANREQRLTLARADLVGAMDPREVAASEIRHLNSTFHFVLDRSRP